LLSFGAESFVFQFAIQKLKNQYIQNYNFPRCFYGCENWSLTLTEERRLRVLENRVLRRVFGPNGDEVTGNGERYIVRSCMICIPYPILCGWLNREE
jgi:hypothetical protein